MPPPTQQRGTEARLYIDSTDYQKMFQSGGSVSQALEKAGLVALGGLGGRAAKAVSGIIGDLPNPTNEVRGTGFSCSIDAVVVGDAFSVRVPNPQGRHAGDFPVGSRIRLYLANDNVNGGQPTLMHDGYLIQRESAVGNQGATLNLTGADRGWFLRNAHVQEWVILQSTSLTHMIRHKGIVDPSWGIDVTNIAADNKINRLIRQGVNQAPATQVQFQESLLTRPLQYVQTEAGQTPMDVLSPYLRRDNLLLGVNVKGQLQLWRPDYDRKPKFRLRLRTENSSSDPNNVMQAQMAEDMTGLNTVTVVQGEKVGQALAKRDPRYQNSGRVKGYFRNKILPFTKRFVVADGEIFDSTTAGKCAAWYYCRNAFDSWTVTYQVKDHWQANDGAAQWWMADELVDVVDGYNGINGKLWIQSVRFDRDMGQGSTTTLVCRKPYLLYASFGVAPSPPRVKSSPPTNTGTPSTTTQTTPAGAPAGTPTAQVTTTTVNH